MTEIRKADPATRRRAVLLVVLCAVVGALLILGFERCRAPFLDWLESEPGKLADRVKLVCFLAAALLSTPLVAVAAYLWRIGGRVLRTGEFPPPGRRVIRDTPVVAGTVALARGRNLKALAVCLGVTAALLCLLLWRLAAVVSERAA